MTDNSIIYVIDDDDAVRSGLKLLLQSEGYQVQDFGSATDFLQSCLVGCECRGCLILDLQMPDMNGLALQQKLIERSITLPIIFLSGHGTIPAAVQALRDGAVDFIEKPVRREHLLNCVQKALQIDAQVYLRTEYKSAIEQRISRLTEREQEIMDLIVDGKANKVIAVELSISERTVELHRSRILRKMEVRNAVELTQLISSVNN